MALVEIKHSSCGKIAFYTRAIPVGREFMVADAITKEGIRVTHEAPLLCLNCEQEVDLVEISDYYSE